MFYVAYRTLLVMFCVLKYYFVDFNGMFTSIKLHSTAQDGLDDGKASSCDEVIDIDNDKQASRGLTCLYTNADSLLNKRVELKATISSIMPNVIAITEVYPKVQVDVDKAELEIDGFDCFVTGPEGRGACIYVKKSLNAKLVEHLTNSDLKKVFGVR